MLRTKRSRFSLENVTFVALATALMCSIFFSHRNPELNNTFSRAVVVHLQPVAMVSHMPKAWLQSAKEALGRHIDVVEENRNLSLRLQHLTLLESDVQHLSRENRKLRKLLDMVAPLSGAPIASDVLFDASGFFKKSIIVRVGDASGVVKGQQVLSGEGLVGRVVDVAAHSARVLLLTDYLSRVPVLFVGADVHGILRGGAGSGLLELIFQEDHVDIDVGDQVVASGLGGMYSAGTPVGIVTYSAGRDVWVRPYVNFSSLSTVVIPRSINRQEGGNAETH